MKKKKKKTIKTTHGLTARRGPPAAALHESK
jgi:hypothetical protein